MTCFPLLEICRIGSAFSVLKYVSFSYGCLSFTISLILLKFLFFLLGILIRQAFVFLDWSTKTILPPIPTFHVLLYFLRDFLDFILWRLSEILVLIILTFKSSFMFPDFSFILRKIPIADFGEKKKPSQRNCFQEQR